MDQLQVTEEEQRWLDTLTLFNKVEAAVHVAVMGAKNVSARTQLAVMWPECPTRDPASVQKEAAKLLSDALIALLKAEFSQAKRQISKARAERLSSDVWGAAP